MSPRPDPAVTRAVAAIGREAHAKLAAAGLQVVDALWLAALLRTYERLREQYRFERLGAQRKLPELSDG